MSLLKARTERQGSSKPLVVQQPASAHAVMAYAQQRVAVDYLTANRARLNLENVAMVYSAAVTLAQAVPAAEPALKGIADTFAMRVVEETRKGL